MFDKRGITEIYKLISDAVDKNPTVQIIIDSLPEGYNDVLDSLPFPAEIRQLRIYYRHGSVPQDHIHRFVPVNPPKVPPEEPEGGLSETDEQETSTVEEVSLEGDHGGKKIVAFSFGDRRQEVDIWKDMLLGVCEILYERHRDKFGKIYEIEGRTRTYFSKTPGGMREPREIGNTGIYAETHASANQLCRYTVRVLDLFGYSSDSVKVEQCDR